MENEQLVIDRNLVNWLCEFTKVKEDRILPTTRIIEDLHVDGDDGYELITQFSKKFNVNIEDFDFKSYFQSEGWSLTPELLANIFRVLLGKKQSPHPKKDFTVADMMRALISKRWNKVP